MDPTGHSQPLLLASLDSTLSRPSNLLLCPETMLVTTEAATCAPLPKESFPQLTHTRSALL